MPTHTNTVRCVYVTEYLPMWSNCIDVCVMCMLYIHVCTRTTTQHRIAGQRKGYEFNTEHWLSHHRRHYHHGVRSSQLVCTSLLHRPIPFFSSSFAGAAAVSFLHQDNLNMSYFISVSPERCVKSQVKWTVLLTMKFESFGIWHSHMSVRASSQQPANGCDINEEKILIVKIRSLMRIGHRIQHALDPIRMDVEDGFCISFLFHDHRLMFLLGIGQPLNRNIFFFTIEIVVGKAIQHSATTQFSKQKHRTSADVFEMPNKESERKRKKPRAADRCDIFFRSFQWHQSLNGRTRRFD